MQYPIKVNYVKIVTLQSSTRLEQGGQHFGGTESESSRFPKALICILKPGATGKPEQWSCPLLGDFPQPPLGRAPCPPPASRTSGRLGCLFPRGQRERGRGRPGRGRAAEQRLSHCVFCLFFSPKVPFPSVRRPAGP